MNIATIRKAYELMKAQTQSAIERKEDKENPTEKDEEILMALEDFQSEMENAFDDLEAAYA